MLYAWFYFIPSYRDQGYVHVVLNEGYDSGPNVFAHACTMKFMHAVNGRKYLLIDDLIYMYAVNGMQEVHYLALGKHPIYIVYGLVHEPFNQSIIANRRHPCI